MTVLCRMDTLPRDHPSRALPLWEIGAGYKRTSEKRTRAITKAYGIARYCFNDLAGVWTKDTEWFYNQEKYHEIIKQASNSQHETTGLAFEPVQDVCPAQTATDEAGRPGAAEGDDREGVRGMSALARQEGGGHYKDFPIQPVEFCQKNKLTFIESCVVKYVCRHGAKNGAQDIKKAIHFLEMLLELEYPEAKNEPSK